MLYVLGLLLLYPLSMLLPLDKVLATPSLNSELTFLKSDWLVFAGHFLLLDFIYYCKHRIDHRLRLFWRLHLVHHSDEYLDLSTSFRHHPFEIVVTYLVILGIASLLGVPLIVLVTYVSISAMFQPLQHLNVNFPTWFEHYLSFVFITPALHAVHHHHDARFTNSNYGNMFSFWDRLFATFRPPEANTRYGLEYFTQPEETRLSSMLSQPFRYLKK
ncbi:sterol desaturase family protein [Salinimonas marina]|uniref:Sterol desaturase family protein n=1 Tax=Salinimonas marina TaxID=2785918 RepID=A0A7S9DWA7_9ALTE|nr:sterol desaturase family protein [Salinimonas marina]QPG05157.1 sterol desaturase family protein [Salinimonas marina]